MLGFGLWGRMAKHSSTAVWQDGMLGSPTQTQGSDGPEGGLISERFEDGSTGDDARPPPPLCGVTAHQETDPRWKCLLNGLRGAYPSSQKPTLCACAAAGLACVGCWMLGTGC